MRARGHLGLLLLGTLNVVGLFVGLGLCTSAQHVMDVVVGLAIVWTTVCASTCCFAGFFGFGLSLELRRFLLRAVLYSSIAIAATALLLLAFNPDRTAVTVAAAFIGGSALNVIAAFSAQRDGAQRSE